MLEIIVGTVLTAILGFIAWLVLKVLDLERKLVELEARIKAREDDCEHHHEWMDKIDVKLDTACSDLSYIRGRIAAKEST